MKNEVEELKVNLLNYCDKLGVSEDTLWEHLVPNKELNTTSLLILKVKHLDNIGLSHIQASQLLNLLVSYDEIVAKNINYLIKRNLEVNYEE